MLEFTFWNISTEFQILKIKYNSFNSKELIFTLLSLFYNKKNKRWIDGVLLYSQSIATPLQQHF